MITITEIASQKLRARKYTHKSLILTDFYNEILDAVSRNKTEGYVDFNAENKKDFETMSEVVKELIESDFYIKRLTKDVNFDEQNFDICFTFDISMQNNY